VSSPLEVGAERAGQAARELGELLEQAGCEVVRCEAISGAHQAAETGRRLAGEGVDAVALAAASWFEDYLALDLLEECPRPLLLWALPGMETGALCGTQQLTCFLRALGQPYAGVWGPVAGGEALKRALVYLRAAAVRARLRRARIGVAGQRIGGMTHTAPAEFALKAVLGPRVVPVDLPQLLARAEAAPREEARARWEELRGRAGACQVADEEGQRALGVYAAVREAVATEGLSALTVGCYPHLMGRVCLAASLLADEGVPLACEGDVNGAVGQLLLYLLTGEPTHHADWLEPLPDGTVVFTHCGSGSLSLAEQPREVVLGPVRLREQGVCALFPARPGPVTLVSLIPYRAGYQCALLEGEALSTEMVFPGNPVRVRFAQPPEALIQWIFEQGIGHHWAIGYGHVGAEIRQWARMCGEGLRLIEAG
jgi:L-fucose isomerase-like protein